MRSRGMGAKIGCRFTCHTNRNLTQPKSGYCPDPVDEFAALISYANFLLGQEKVERIFHQLLEGLQKLRAGCAVDDAMVAGHCDAHDVTHDNLVVAHDWFGGHRAYRQNRSFGWIDYRGELINTEHTQITNGKSCAGVFFGS